MAMFVSEKHCDPTTNISLIGEISSSNRNQKVAVFDRKEIKMGLRRPFPP
jgi:hypothetical protein